MHKRFAVPAIAPQLILRLGLAFVFAYAAISAFREPAAWVYYVPHFVNKFMAAETFLKLFGIFQLILALVLVIGKWVQWAALLAALSLLGLIVFNGSAFLITFRDVGLVCMATALFLMEAASAKSKQ